MEKGFIIIPLQAGPKGAAPEWVHLLPGPGTIKGRNGAGPYVMPEVGRVLKATLSYHAGALIPIDFEHQAFRAKDNGKPAPAAGWIKALEERADGLWGQVDWTPKAAAMIGAKEYRYLSPVFLNSPQGVISFVWNAALTNLPNLQLVALASAVAGGDMDTEHDFLNQARTLLSLPATADGAAVLDTIKDLVTAKNSAIPDPRQYVPFGAVEEMASELASIRAKGTNEQMAGIMVNTAIKTGQMAPALKDWAVALCCQDVGAFERFIERTGGTMQRLFQSDFDKEGRPLRMLAQMSQTGGRVPSSSGLTTDQEEVCRKMGLSPDEFLAAKKG